MCVPSLPDVTGFTNNAFKNITLFLHLFADHLKCKLHFYSRHCNLQWYQFIFRTYINTYLSLKKNLLALAVTQRLGFEGGQKERGREKERERERLRLLFFLHLFACFLEVPYTRLSDDFDVLGIGTVAGSLAAVFDSRDLLWALVGCTAPSLYLKFILSFQALWLQDSAPNSWRQL